MRAAPPSPLRPAGSGSAIAVSLFLVALVLLVFLASLRNGFVNYDDDLYVYANAHVQGGLSWENFRWAWTTLEGGFWHPLTWLSHMLDCQLFGLHATGHHLTSLLLHAANTVLLFVALRRMTRAQWPSALAAAFFALHPLHVETVAWVSDRKDLLGALFWLLTLLAYAAYVRASKVSSLKSKVCYGAALLAFAAAMMSKATALTLPFVLLLLDYWPLARVRLKTLDSRPKTLTSLLLEKLPFLALGAVLGALAVWGQATLGAVGTVSRYPIRHRLYNALLSYAHYLAQTFWPAGLTAFYPYPTAFPPGPAIIVAVAGVVVTLAVLRAAGRRPFLAVGWLWFVLTLLPQVGLLQIGSHARADRYTYLPLAGLFILLAWSLDELRGHRPRTIGAVAGLSVAACALLSARQAQHWRTSETLFRHALAVTTGNWVAHSHLGLIRASQGSFDEAVAECQTAARLAPESLEVRSDLVTVLAQSGQLDNAAGQCRLVLQSHPDNLRALDNLGIILTLQGKLADAVAQFQRVLHLDPNHANTYANLGNALAAQNRFPEALAAFRHFVRLQPADPRGHQGLGRGLLELGQPDEAIAEFNTVLRLHPADPEASHYLRLAREGQTPHPAPQR